MRMARLAHLGMPVMPTQNAGAKLHQIILSSCRELSSLPGNLFD
jgi:hypothetical protein